MEGRCHGKFRNLMKFKIRNLETHSGNEMIQETVML
jgi:hypothetical protein